MIHWNPLQQNIKVWTPVGGWSTALSEKEKVQCTGLFFFLKEKKGYTESMAETLSYMAIFKQKYHGLRYSEEQEYIMSKAFLPLIHSAKA